jgi:DNA-directed RNA polymerase subunit M/transcription elongation factor TFIIS
MVTGATLTAPPQRLAADPKRIYTCPECEHVLRVSGLGRHRVYFELTDERSDDAVMNRVCPVCEHGLPGKNRA